MSPNAATAEVPRWIQQHVDQVYQWIQMVKTEDILTQQLLDSLDEKYFKGKRQAYIRYSKLALTGIIHHLYDDHGTISPMDIE